RRKTAFRRGGKVVPVKGLLLATIAQLSCHGRSQGKKGLGFTLDRILSRPKGALSGIKFRVYGLSPGRRRPLLYPKADKLLPSNFRCGGLREQYPQFHLPCGRPGRTTPGDRGP